MFRYEISWGSTVIPINDYYLRSWKYEYDNETERCYTVAFNKNEYCYDCEIEINKNTYNYLKTIDKKEGLDGIIRYLEKHKAKIGYVFDIETIICLKR